MARTTEDSSYLDHTEIARCAQPSRVGHNFLAIVGSVCEGRLAMIDVSALVRRYERFHNSEPVLATIFQKFVQIRRDVIEYEHPDFDDASTQGMRFFVGCVNYATGSKKPTELRILDESRGVFSICDHPFKIYKPKPDGKPRTNKTRISHSEYEQLALIDLPPDHYLLRVDVDDIGDPVALRWEEWTNGQPTWSVTIYDSTIPAPLRAVDSQSRPAPAEALPVDIGADVFDVEDHSDDDNDR